MRYHRSLHLHLLWSGTKGKKKKGCSNERMRIIHLMARHSISIMLYLVSLIYSFQLIYSTGTPPPPQPVTKWPQISVCIWHDRSAYIHEQGIQLPDTRWLNQDVWLPKPPCKWMQVFPITKPIKTLSIPLNFAQHCHCSFVFMSAKQFLVFDFFLIKCLFLIISDVWYPVCALVYFRVCYNSDVYVPLPVSLNKEIIIFKCILLSLSYLTASFCKTKKRDKCNSGPSPKTAFTWLVTCKKIGYKSPIIASPRTCLYGLGSQAGRCCCLINLGMCLPMIQVEAQIPFYPLHTYLSLLSHHAQRSCKCKCQSLI